jgi:hypothetical protein
MSLLSEGEERLKKQAILHKIDQMVIKGDIKKVMDFCETHQKWSIHGATLAALNGHYDIVNYFISKGYGVYGEGLIQLHHQGKTEMIKFIHEKKGWILSAPDVWKNLYVL